MNHDRKRSVFGFLSLFLASWLLAPSPSGAQQIKPRILIIFDTSTSMLMDIDRDDDFYTFGDGSWDPWSGGRYCCPGEGNSRMYAAKEAMRQMISATGDIEFALMKYAQEYAGDPSNGGHSGWVDGEDSWPGEAVDYIKYMNNQTAPTNDTNYDDRMRYRSFEFNYTCYTSAQRSGQAMFPYDPSDLSVSEDWLCVPFPSGGTDNRDGILMWMNHHEYSSTNLGQPATDLTGTSFDGLEQELRASGATPLAFSMVAATQYISDIYDADTDSDCRQYSVILLTDGDESCEMVWNPTGGPDNDGAWEPDVSAVIDAADDLKSLSGRGIDLVNVYVIGLNITDESLQTLGEIASEIESDTKLFEADSQEGLSTALYNIINDSIRIEVCNDVDDDCDDQIDEGFVNTDAAYCDPFGEVEDQHSPTGTNPETDRLVCERPSERLCDGIDDNCDGVTDEPPDVAPYTPGSSWDSRGACGGCEDQDPCVYNAASRCVQGSLECIPGCTPPPGGDCYQCVGSVGPTEETCNGIDDDCDGEIDEGLAGAIGCGPCDDDDRLFCFDNEMKCCAAESTAQTGCIAVRLPSEELCDGLDNDCDDEIDEDLSKPCGGGDCPVSQTCPDGPNQGICRVGQKVCDHAGGTPDSDNDGNWSACNGSVEPEPNEVPEAIACNGQDDDCDGETDEDYGIGEDCGTCGGNLYCINGAETCCAGLNTNGGCNPVPTPQAEVCDGVDNDCDGEIDEEIPPRSCMNDDYDHLDGIGICHEGYQICGNGEWGGVNPETETWETNYCIGEQLPREETCNLLDDNCDGTVDENITGDLNCGQCGDGQEVCITGAMQCCAVGSVAPDCGALIPPQVETCNNIDDDCDGDTDEFLKQECIGPELSELQNAYGTISGICHGGIQTCRAGEWGFGATVDSWETGICGNQQLPDLERCDCLDNDCDGETDESFPEEGTACNACGFYQCDPEKCGLICDGFETPEECDGIDNNCNGLIDEAIYDPCGGCVEPGENIENPEMYEDCLAAQAANPEIKPDEGECQFGVAWCAPDEDDKRGECDGSIGPARELCDNLDNDCDAETDEEDEIENVGGECAIEVGICEAAWWRCVVSADGVKGLECCKDVTSENACIPPQGPGVEVCNNIDDDCDGSTDEELQGVNDGEPCGNSLGECDPGRITCICDPPDSNNCDMVCVGATEGTPEVCDGLDNDCDGETDEDLPMGNRCLNEAVEGNLPVGECDWGYEECFNGEWVCNAPPPMGERCDFKDNDCDGVTDEDLVVECPKDSVCIEGECARLCVGQELSCPKGMTCREVLDAQGKELPVCLTDVCDPNSDEALPCVNNPYWCDEGEEPYCVCDVVNKRCINICNNINCAQGTICRPSTGTCHVTTGEDCYATGCSEGKTCQGGICSADPCATANCTEGQYCNDLGACVDVCSNMTSCDGVCIEGECKDLCADVSCLLGETCNPYTGACELAGACDTVSCEYYEICENGLCIEDPCWNIDCPAGFMCEHGHCRIPPNLVPEDTDIDTSGGADTDTMIDTTNIEPVSTDTGGVIVADTETDLGMTSILATGRGGCLCTSTPGASHKSTGLPAFLLGLFFALMRVFSRRRKNLMVMGTLILMTGLVLGCSTDPYKFDQSQRQSSDGLDTNIGTGDNVDTMVDTSTLDGGVQDTSCVPDGGDYTCDEIDNDCDGKTDEDVNKQLSILHCGSCDNDCMQKFPGAEGQCQDGVCIMTACLAHFQDVNQSDTDGCEYACEKTVEPEDNRDVCDGIAAGPNDTSYVGKDNDCDTRIDEDVDLQTDPYNCGWCGHTCIFPNAVAECVAGQCTFGSGGDGAGSGCLTGFYDIDGDPENGCEYSCSPTSSVEECDNLDNNCDGQTDEGNPGGGTPCHPIEGLCAANADGVLECPGICVAGRTTCIGDPLNFICEGYVSPKPMEECNQLDDNCDGETDENLHRECSTQEYDETGLCHHGIQSCGPDGWPTECDGEVVPTAEKCDGVDNDCDGQTDEEVYDLINDPQPCAGTTAADAYEGHDPNRGECQPGHLECIDSADVCVGAILPTEELCDGLNSDCDEFEDEDETSLTQQCWSCDTNIYTDCETRQLGLCQPGIRRCVVDSEGNYGYGACQGSIAPEAESCDGLDNDCDGVTDEDDSGAPLTDPTATCGTCGGFEHCINGHMECCVGFNDDGSCISPPTPSVEQCDGLDNDCDGTTDNNLPQALCDGDDDDECLEGIVSCIEGAVVCTDNTDSSVEVCDGIDNDCDGLTDDNDNNDFPLVVPEDLCPSCAGLVGPTCDGTTGWRCEYRCADGPTHAANEVQCDDQGIVVRAETWCNDMDDDCDGDTDEGLTASVENCGTCGNVCDRSNDLDHAISWACVDGTCRVNECQTGWWDWETNNPEECEYECTINAATNGQEGTVCNNIDDDCDGITDNGLVFPEICDGVDNDCDGDVDADDSDLSAPAICNDTCDPGSYAVHCDEDADAWVCEYDCSVVDCVDNVGGYGTQIEQQELRCDGIDNNCDGTIDEGFTLWSNPASIGDYCTNNGDGGCYGQGRVACAPDNSGYVCCEADRINSSGICTSSTYVIPETPTPASETSGEYGVDDDCDGVTDDGVTACAGSIVTIPTNDGTGTYQVFRYEASRWDASSTNDGNSVPCSASGVMPWTNITFNDAREACNRLNAYPGECYDSNGAPLDTNNPNCWDLCTPEQWYHACAYGDAPSSETIPNRYPYGDSYSGTTCNGIDASGSGLVETGSLTNCYSDRDGDRVNDLSGNAEEWTLEERSGGSTALRVIRGGSYNSVSNALTCGADLIAGDEGNYQLEQIGFRCCLGNVSPLNACELAINNIYHHPFSFEGDIANTCSPMGWLLRGEWELGTDTGSTPSNAVGNCIIATDLNDTYDDDNTRVSAVSPSMDLTDCNGLTGASGGSVHLVFDIWYQNGGDDLDIMVRSDSNNNDASDDNWHILERLNGSGSGWITDYSVDVSTYANNDLFQARFAYNADSDTSDLGTYIDNVRLEYRSAAANTPTPIGSGAYDDDLDPQGTEPCGNILYATIRDFPSRLGEQDDGDPSTEDDHQDFQIPGVSPLCLGMVQNQLVEENIDDAIPGLGTKLVPAAVSSNPYNSSHDCYDLFPDQMDDWYTESYSPYSYELALELVNIGNDEMEFYSDSFFPLDDLGSPAGSFGWGIYPYSNPSYQHNYHFTTEIRTWFTYEPGQVFEFRGDDDVWVFINGYLELDLGGIHSENTGTIDLDDLDYSELTPGFIYALDVFHAERNVVASNFKITTNLCLQNVE